ncbi:polynucleotide kinase 3 phosphatase-domain-containing protein [Vararia minispora EC-137]|uniref:Polynucleotide kinase 3 phosphatase-domain-containing protein n=1 Tax=Vararia minispora EC-137 TaxID=1314806 RepID=A0ACB8Q8J0_9AGAM|nr:polynucleotide kinase 3 phosphatase-domain-containing protein [Vararia minispora EC-137]
MPFRWLKPSLGPKRTCLHGIHLSPKSSSKVAMFDLDGTIIESQFGKGKRNGSSSGWKWWKSVVPKRLKELQEQGYSIAIISNQKVKGRVLEDFKNKIPSIAKAIPDIPFHIFAATSADGFRKPMVGIWRELERIFAEDGITVDRKISFFVGDAAGRAEDFASTDRKFAENIGVEFHTPEFQKSCVGPRVTFPDLPLVSPTTPELILFVGMPCLGKTTFYHSHFAPAGYSHINQDVLKSRPKCLKAAEGTLAQGKSCVVDNTNRDVATRKYYIELAKKHEVPVRCFVFDGSLELAWHNNLYRAYNMSPAHAEKEGVREILPYMAFSGFRDSYEAPTEGEGFSEIRTVKWVFEGNDEERRRWEMWLQVSGK